MLDGTQQHLPRDTLQSASNAMVSRPFVRLSVPLLYPDHVLKIIT